MIHENIPIDQLGRLIAYNEHSVPVPLAKLWSGSTAVLVFVRHFG